MNPLQHIFVLIILLLAGTNNSYASSLEYKANQAFIYSILRVEFSHQSSERIEPGSLLADKCPWTVIDTIDQFTFPCDQILESEVIASPPGSLPEKVLCKLATDLADFPELSKLFDSAENVGGRFVKAWAKFLSSADDGIRALRTDAVQLRKFVDLIENNDLGLDEDKLLEILNAAAVKGLKWDFPENILTAVKRASDANIPGLKVTHKKFPESAGSGSGYLVPAKYYQKAASGDANISFDLNGRSFDDIGADRKLIDRKYGYGNSIFDKIEDEFGEVLLEVANTNRIRALFNQAKGQIQAAGGKPIRWEISNQTGATGIHQLFNGNLGANFRNLPEFSGTDFSLIEVLFKP